MTNQPPPNEQPSPDPAGTAPTQPPQPGTALPPVNTPPLPPPPPQYGATPPPPSAPPVAGLPPQYTTPSPPQSTPPAVGLPPQYTTPSPPPCAPPVAGLPPQYTTPSPPPSAQPIPGVPPTPQLAPPATPQLNPYVPPTASPLVASKPRRDFSLTGVVIIGIVAALALILAVLTAAGLITLPTSSDQRTVQSVQVVTETPDETPAQQLPSPPQATAIDPVISQTVWCGLLAYGESPDWAALSTEELKDIDRIARQSQQIAPTDQLANLQALNAGIESLQLAQQTGTAVEPSTLEELTAAYQAAIPAIQAACPEGDR